MVADAVRSIKVDGITSGGPLVVQRGSTTASTTDAGHIIMDHIEQPGGFSVSEQLEGDQRLPHAGRLPMGSELINTVL